MAVQTSFITILKGLGNLNADHRTHQNITESVKTVEKLKQNYEKTKILHGWAKLEKDKTVRIWLGLKNISLIFI